MKKFFSKKNTVWIVSLFLIVICAITLLLNNKRSKETVLLYDNSAISYEPKNESTAAVKDDQIVLPGLKEVMVNQGASEVILPLYNIKSNDVDLVFEVKLEEQDKVLRSTQRVAPGKAVLMVPLPPNLASGTYHLKIMTTVYKKGRDSKLNSGVVMTKLIVHSNNNL